MIKRMIRSAIDRHLQNILRVVTLIARNHKKEVERIHCLRTETRRASAGLRLFVERLSQRRTKWMQHQLGLLREKAGSVRDLDILPSVLSDHFNRMPEHVRVWVSNRIAKSRADQMRLLRRYCRRLLERGFERRVRLLTRRIGCRHRTCESELAGFCSSELSQLAATFFEAVEFLKTDNTYLHKVRILGRRLRYSLDLLRDMVPGSTVDTACQDLTEIQEILGRAHDQTVALQYLQGCVEECEMVADALLPLTTDLDLSLGNIVKSHICQSLDLVERVRNSFETILQVPKFEAMSAETV